MSCSGIGEGTKRPHARVAFEISTISICKLEFELFLIKSAIAADELYPSPAQISKIARSSS